MLGGDAGSTAALLRERAVRGLLPEYMHLLHQSHLFTPYPIRSAAVDVGWGDVAGEEDTTLSRRVDLMLQREMGVQEQMEQREEEEAEKENSSFQRAAIEANYKHHNDYSMCHFDTGARPHNFVRYDKYGSGMEDYPVLRNLLLAKDQLFWLRATTPLGLRLDLNPRVTDLQKALGVRDNPDLRFDLILIDPPWEEYVRRAPTTETEWWPREQIEQLPIADISAPQSFCVIWCGSEGTETGRYLLKRWGFRRCEDIVWGKSNKGSFKDGRGDAPERHKVDTLAVDFDENRNILKHTKEHLLVGIKGVLKRNADSHFVHCNVDTDVLISEEPPHGSTMKPQSAYSALEHFCLGRRRLELFGNDANLRPGWVTVGKDITLSNYTPQRFLSMFSPGMPPGEWWSPEQVVRHNQRLCRWRNTKQGGGNLPTFTTPPQYCLGSSHSIEETRPQTPPAAGFKEAVRRGQV